MPVRPGEACRRPGCPGVVRGGVCGVCGPRNRQRHAQHDAQRATAAQRGYDATWQRLRLRYLMQHPLCAECARQGRVTAATDVHHIVPRRDGGPDEDSNLMALCHACHSRVTGQGG